MDCRKRMMKRLTKESWRALRIFNPHELCERGGSAVYVSYRARVTGRGAQTAAWQVIRPDGAPTDPSAAWYNYGHKTFLVMHPADKEAKRLEAIGWASFVYDIKGEWERDPWGDWHPEGTLEAAAKVVEPV